MQCLTFNVLGYVDGSFNPTGVNDHAWTKQDGLVKLWIYGTVTPPLLKPMFQAGGTAQDIWLCIENQFHNNKEARAIQIENELWTLEIGDQSILEYPQTLKSFSDLLSNLNPTVNERNLVMYMLNGLKDKFDNIINVTNIKIHFHHSAMLNQCYKIKKNASEASKQNDNLSCRSHIIFICSNSRVISFIHCTSLISAVKDLKNRNKKKQ